MCAKVLYIIRFCVNFNVSRRTIECQKNAYTSSAAEKPKAMQR